MAHGIMFHHFHSEVHPERSGSISADELERMITHIEGSHKILDPRDFQSDLERNQLENDAVILSFDDGLLCQIDVALPVLESKSIRALFNIYTGVFDSTPPPLEVFSFFRETFFGDFLKFWADFYKAFLDTFPSLERRYVEEYPAGYLDNFPFYSSEERRFRFIRDKVLNPQDYELIMWHMIDQSGFDVESAKKSLWMSTEDVKRLEAAGHSIGLHSHTHPMTMSSLPSSRQRQEFLKNQEVLASILGFEPTMMAHPCGSYSGETIDILEQLGVRLGFRSSLTPGNFSSNLEIPRQNHSNLMKAMFGR